MANKNNHLSEQKNVSLGAVHKLRHAKKGEGRIYRDKI